MSVVLEKDLASSCNTRASNNSFEITEDKVYPNPFNNIIYLQKATEISKLTITSILGAEIVSYTKVLASGIDLSFMAKGMYLCTYTNIDGNTHTVKVIKE